MHTFDGCVGCTLPTDAGRDPTRRASRRRLALGRVALPRATHCLVHTVDCEHSTNVCGCESADTGPGAPAPWSGAPVCRVSRYALPLAYRGFHRVRPDSGPPEMCCDRFQSSPLYRSFTRVGARRSRRSSPPRLAFRLGCHFPRAHLASGSRRTARRIPRACRRGAGRAPS